MLSIFTLDLVISYTNRQTVGIPMGTNCALLVADVFVVVVFFGYENDFSF